MKSRIAHTVVALGTVMVVGGCAPTEPAADSGPTVLRMADSFSPTHPIGVGGTSPFLEHLREHGPAVGLEIEYFESGQMGKQRDMATALRTGIVDIAPVTPAYVGAELPMSSVADLPGLMDDVCVGSRAILATMQEGGTLFEEELSVHGVRPIWTVMLPNIEVMTSDQVSQIRLPEDMEGVLLRSPGGVADRVLTGLDAAAVSMPVSDLYEALTRGTVDGALTSSISVAPYKLGEALAYSTRGARLGGFTVTYSVADETWKQLSDEQRQVIADASEKAQVGACAKIAEGADTSFDQLVEQGMTITELTEDEQAQWNAVTDPMQQSWVDDLEAMGKPAQAVLDEYKRNLEEANNER